MQAKTAATQQAQLVQPAQPPEPEQAAQPVQSGADPNLATKLLRAIAVKTLIELLFICFLATYAAFVNYSPLLRGAIDRADQTHVAGWAHDPQTPTEALEVQLFIDDHFVATGRAGERRDDLVQAGATTLPNHGYSFDLSAVQLAPGEHTAQVYALRRAAGINKMLVPLSREPMIFRVNPSQYRSR
jgi:hypothetical protein